MKVKVNAPYQVKADGKYLTAADGVVEVDDALGKRWIQSGLVKAVTISKNKAVTGSPNKAAQPAGKENK